MKALYFVSPEESEFLGNYEPSDLTIDDIKSYFTDEVEQQMAVDDGTPSDQIYTEFGDPATESEKLKLGNDGDVAWGNGLYCGFEWRAEDLS